MKNLTNTIFISLISISLSSHSQDSKFQCEGMETQDYVINGEESWWGEWAGMKELGVKPFVVGIENEMVSLNYPFEFKSKLSLTDDYYKSTDTVTLKDDLKVDIYLDVHRDTGMTFIQLHTFNSQNPTKKIGKGHIENGTKNVRLYELIGDCKVK